MISYRNIRLIYGIIILLVIGIAIAGVVYYFLHAKLAHSIYFDDSLDNVIKLGNRAYEVGINKTNGGIAYIKAAGQLISAGNSAGCLWDVNFGINNIPACSFTPEGPNRFRYTWSSANNRLVLSYTPDPSVAKGVTVSVTIAVSESNWLDLQMILQNNRGFPPLEIKFPNNLVFVKDEIREALLPVIPGIALEPGFFSRQVNYEASYPGYPGVFADFMALSSNQGSFAMYSIADTHRIEPVYYGFNFTSCVGEDRVCYTHNYKTRVPEGSRWISPRLRLRVSESWEESINHFREDDGIAALPLVTSKLSKLYQKVAQSPLYKADTTQLHLQFKDYPALLARIPYPGLLHVMAYEPRGFDRNYPDFLPPDPLWGTVQDMADMFHYARSRGYVVMPYINPTWWDGESPTLKHLPAPLTIKDVASRSDQGMPVEECYGCPANPHYGYVMSPYVTFVRTRLDQLIHQMHVDLRSDLLFEDQIGARATVFDYNPASPSPEAYTQGWVEHTRLYSDSLLMTESGFDRLVETETGFHGSVLLAEKKGETAAWWGDGTWHYYPFVTLLARDKALFYQHDLAPETFTHNQATFAWNVAIGYMLSYDLFPSEFGGGVMDDWIKLVGSFQRFVLSQYASERLVSYADLKGKVTRSTFETFSVDVNWDGVNPATIDEFVLPPLGLLIRKNDGSLCAGLFTGYNNILFDDSAHYVIEERGTTKIVLRLPVGGDTSITLRLLPGWKTTTSLEVWALTSDGKPIGQVPPTLSSNGVTFRYQHELSGQPVAYFEIIKQ